MRAPPPVQFNSTLSRAWRAALALLAGVSVAVPVAWTLPWLAASGEGRWSAAWLQTLGDPLVQAVLALSAAALVVGALWLARRRCATAGRTLRWDGQDWLLDGHGGGPGQRGDADLMLDLGPWMLVRFRPLPPRGARAATWLTLSAAGDAARWAALRGALWNWRAGPGDARR
jgi:hypothetical protein